MQPNSPDTPEAPGPSEAPPNQASRGFRRLAWLVLASLGVMVLVAAVTTFVLYRSATAEVPEYEAVVEIDPAAAETQRKAFESQIAALASDVQALPEWRTRLTEDQINAWLATRLERDLPGFTKAGILSPRVILSDGQVTCAAKSELTRVRGVVSVTLTPRITELDELALEVSAARIGNLPIPLDALMAQLRKTPIVEIGPVRLAQTGDTAAAVVDLERMQRFQGKSVRLTGVDIREGELLLRGETRAPE